MEEYDITGAAAGRVRGSKKVGGKDEPYPSYQIIEIHDALNKIQGGLTFGQSMVSSHQIADDLINNINFLKSAQIMSPQLIALAIKYRAQLEGSQQRILDNYDLVVPKTKMTSATGASISKASTITNLIFIIFGITDSDDQEAFLKDFETHVKALFTKKFEKASTAGDDYNLLYETAIGMSKYHAELFEWDR
jgi:hypothetical protein